MSDGFDVALDPLPDGIAVIEASAGTGKTYTLCALALRLALEGPCGRPIPLERILFVTFTKAATEELALRLRERIEEAKVGPMDPVLRAVRERLAPEDFEERLCRAAAAVDRLAVRTLDSLAFGFLRREARRFGHDSGLEVGPSSGRWVRRAALAFWHEQVDRAPPLAAAALAALDLNPDDLIDFLKQAEAYPRLRFDPPALSVAEALAELSSVERLGSGLDQRLVQDALEMQAANAIKSGKWPGRAFDRQSLAEWLAPTADGPTRIAAMILLGLASARASLSKKFQSEWDRLPFVAACVRAHAAANGLFRALCAEAVVRLPKEAKALRERRGQLAYADVQAIVAEGLADPAQAEGLVAAFRKDFDAALIDEFQDTDRSQWSVFQKLFPTGPLWIVGDPKQAIYEFRGADPVSWRSAIAGASSRFILGTNWRSRDALVDAVQWLFRSTQDPFLDPGIGLPEVKGSSTHEDALQGPWADRPALEVLWLEVPPGPKGQALIGVGEARRAVVQATVQRVLAWLGEGHSIDGRPAAPEDVAILVRRNADGRAVADALREAGIPAVHDGDVDLHATEAAADLAVLLEAFGAPRHFGLRRRAYATRAFGLDRQALLELESGGPNAEDLAAAFQRAAALATETGLLAAVRAIFAGTGARARLATEEDGTRYVQDLEDLCALYDRRQRDGLSDLAAIAMALAEARDVGRGTSEPAPRSIAETRDAVQVVTIHKSKGLEYAYVICPFAAIPRSDPAAVKPVFVREGTSGSKVAFEGLARDRALEEANAQELGEELRLLYVALTRAIHRAEVLVPPVKDAPWTALCWLLFGGWPEGAPDEGRAGKLKAILELWGANHAGWREAFARRCQASRGLVGWAALSTDDLQPSRWDPAPRSEAPPLARRPTPRTERGLSVQRLWSFTAWREVLQRAPNAGEPVAMDSASAAGPPGLLAAFPRGARAGRALHRLLEASIGAPLAEAELAALVQKELARAGLVPPGDSAEPIAQCMHAFARAAVAAPWFARGQSLSGLQPESAVAEFEFELAPVRPDLSRLGAALTLSEDAWIQQYGRALTRRSGPLRLAEGPFKGFIDLVIFDDDRIQVIDWKSHDLGAEPSCYAESALQTALAADDYLLQLHLYALAVDRYRQSRSAAPRRIEARAVYLRGLGQALDHGLIAFEVGRAVLEALEAALAAEDAS